MTIKRNISSKLALFKDKLVFISGPRQAGKTFIITHDLKPQLLLNMDVARDRIAFKKFPDFIIDWYKTNFGPFPQTETVNKPIVFIDEIHKVTGWRNIIKGTFDKTSHAIRFIASGSSAFKLRKQDKGDSLAGRAIWLNMFPVTFGEYVRTFAGEMKLCKPYKCETSLVESVRENLGHAKKLRELWDEYSEFGSFPENLVQKNKVFYKQWLEDYLSAMLERDMKDLHLAKDVERVYQVFELLLEGLGSTYSLRSIAENLGVSPNTVKSDVQTIKQVLWGFELPVADVSKAKQVRKEKKFYPMDFCFTAYKDPLIDGAKFECMVACILNRGLYEETSGFTAKYKLGYFRDYNQKETDFVAQKGKEIVLAVECKLKSRRDTSNLKSFQKFKPKESILVVEESGVFEAVTDNTYAISVELLASCFE